MVAPDWDSGTHARSLEDYALVATAVRQVLGILPGSWHSSESFWAFHQLLGIPQQTGKIPTDNAKEVWGFWGPLMVERPLAPEVLWVIILPVSPVSYRFLQ